MEYIEQEKNTEVHDFLGRCPCATLATKNARGEVDLAHVFVYFDLAFNGYFVSKIDTRKIDNISKIPEITMLFSDIDALVQVECKGSVHILEDTADIIAVFPKLQELFKDQRDAYWVPPVSQTPGEGYAIVKINPSKIVYRDYSREEKDAGPYEHEVKLFG